MEPDEILAEIERRKKRAKDLKLGEELWSLYTSVLRRSIDDLQRDIEVVYPPLRESLSHSHGTYRFVIGNTKYKVIYREGRREKNERIARLTGIETVKTPITLALYSDDKLVFEFEMKTVITNATETSASNEEMEEITAFVEGPWILAIAELVDQASQHRLEIWKKRNASKSKRDLRADMKRFGLRD